MKPKTRSNILASILQNPTLLEEAYEASKNSQGVGQRELDVYLSSIEARMAKIKNNLHEILTNTVDSEGFKVLLDIINQLISAVGTLTKTFGGLNVILGTISGFMLQKNGLGMLSTAKGVGWLSLMQNMRTKNAAVGINKIDALKNSMPSWFSNFNSDESITKQLSTKGVTNPIDAMRASPVFGPMIQDMKDYEINSITAGQAQENLAQRIDETAQSAKKFSSFLPSLRSIVSGLLTTVAITVALKGISMFVEALYKLATARKDAIKAGKEAIKDMEETGKSYKDATASVKTFNEENAKRYFELKNKNDKQQLSTDEYEEFTQISKEMADLFPSLVTGFDDQGNAMVNLGNDAGEAKDKLAELLQQEKEIADFKIAENLQKAVKGIVYENEDLQDDVDKQDKLIKTLTGTKDLLNDGKSFSDFESDFITFSRNGGKIVTQTIQGVSTEAEIALANAYISAFDKAATSEGYRHGIESFEVNGVELTTIDLGELDESQAESFLDAFKAMATEAGIDIEEQLTNAMMIKSQDEQEIKANWNSIVPGLISSMNLYDTFADLDEHGSLGETLKQMVIDDITGIGGEIQDWEDEDVDKLVKQTRSFVRQKYWDPIRKAIYDTEGNYQEDNAKILDQMLSLEDTDGISVKKYQGQIKNLVDQLFEGFDNAEELREELLVALDIKYVTEDGKSEFTSDKQLLEVAKAAGLMNDGQDEATIERVLGHQLDESQLSFVSKELEEGLFTFNNEDGEKTIDDFVEYVTKKMEEAKKASKIEPQDTLIDIFNDETYKTNAEEYEKKLTSLTGALKTIREEGTLTAEAMRDLQEEFPDLTDFSMQGIEEKATGELKKWIEELRKGYDDLNEEGKAQIDTYTENLERSYGNLHVTEEQAMKAAKQSVVGSNGVDRLGVYNKTMDELIERIKKRYGDVNWQLILELALEDNLSGNIDDIYDKYNHKVVTWELELKSNEIQNEIDNLTSERDVNSARQSLNAANGYSMTAEDYDKDNTISEGLIAAYKEQRQIAIDKVSKLYTERGLQIPKEVQDQLKKDLANYDKLILDEQTKQVENTNAKEKLPLTQLQNQAELLGLDQDSAKDAISRAEKRGKEITKAQYEAAIEAEKANKDNLRRQHRELIETQQELIASGDNTADNELWRVNQKAIQDNEKAYEDAKDAIDDYSKSIENIPLSHLQNSLKDIDRELELNQRELENPKQYATGSDYVHAIQSSNKKVQNLQNEIDEKNKDVRSTWAENSQGFIQWKEELQELENQLYETQNEQYELNKSYDELPVENIVRSIEKYKDALSSLSAEQEYYKTKGQFMTAEDYQAITDINTQMAEEALGADEQYERLEKIAERQYDQKWLDEIRAERAANMQSYYGYMSEAYVSDKAKRDLPITEITRDIEGAKLEAQQFQNALDEVSRSGRDLTEADYSNLQNNAKQQYELYNRLRNENLSRANTSEGQEQVDYMNAAVEAESAMASLKQQQYEWNEAVKQLPVNNLINSVGGYKDLQREAAEVEKELNEADQKHQKTSGKLYDDLIKNGKQQIDNLKKQRDKWRELQNEVRKGSQKWQEYQDEIDTVNNSIDEMEQNQRAWIETMSSLVSTNAAELSSVLTTAFSEINSETGLTIETMNELERQFSDLEGYDISKAFYQTADGMKFNEDAVEALVDAEYELQTMNLYDTIAQQEEIIHSCGDAQDESAQQTKAAAEQRIQAAKRELSMLQALYDQQKQQFSGYSQWQNAQQTENAGAHYTDLQGYLETQQENRKKGLTGTDEFKEYTKYFSEYGIDTLDEWDRVKDKVARYMTEEVQGVANFWKDMYDKGLATKDEEGNYLANFEDTVEAARSMGMSEEWFRDMLGRSGDYGARQFIVDSELDGMLQMQDETEKLVEATLALNKAKREGASQEIIDNQQEYVNQLRENVDNIQEATNVVTEHQGEVSSTELRNAVSDIEELQKLREGASVEQQKLINDQIQAYADAHHIMLTPEFEVDEKAMQEAYPDYDVDLNIHPTLPNGIDLTNRPQVSSETMRAAGYDVEDGDYATVFSSFVTNRDFEEGDAYLDATQALVYTPILPDGRVLDEETASQYAYDALNGIEPPEPISLMMFEGEDAYQQAANYSEALHLVQEAYYADEEGFNSLMQTIQQYGADDLSSIIFGDGELQGPEGLEQALDSMLEYFDLGQEQGQALVEVLKQMFSFGTEDMNWYKYNIGNLGATQVGVENINQVLRDQDIALHRGTGAASYLDLDFNYEEMSLEEIRQKMEEIRQSKNEIDVSMSPEAEQAKEDLQEIHDALMEKYVLKLDAEGLKDENGGQIYHEGQVVTKQAFDESPELQQELRQTVFVDMDYDEYTAFCEQVHDTVLTQKIQTAVATGQIQTEGKTDEEIKQQILDLKIVTDETQLDAAVQKAKELSEVSMVVRIADDQLQQLLGKDESAEIEVGANTEGAQQEVNKIETDINSKHPKMHITADNESALSIASRTSSYIEGMTPKLHVSAETSGLVTDIQSKLNQKTFDVNVKVNKTINTTRITTNAQKEEGGTGGVAGLNNGGFSFVGGTSNVAGTPQRHNKETLVGEEGYEIHVDRDGRHWQVVGENGPEFRDDIKPNDIVFNHEQSEKLLKNGHTNKQGKALAEGTALGAGGATFSSVYSDPEIIKDAISNATDATIGSTAAINTGAKEVKKQTKSLNRFQKALENLKDWVEVRLQRRDEAIQLYETRAELQLKHQNKNAKIEKAEKQNNKKETEAAKAVDIYTKQAQKVMNIALKTGLIPNTKKGKARAQDLYDKVVSGALSIEKMKGLVTSEGKAISTKKAKGKESYTSKELTYVEALTEWIDKAAQARQTLEECRQKAKELAQTRLDNITEQFETLAGYAQSVISVSDSMMALTTAKGQTAVNDEAFKKEYRTQMTQQNYTTGYLRAELKAYDKEMEHALEVFGRDSNEYHQALTKQNEIQQAINESEQKYYDMRKQAAELEFTYISQIIDRIKAVQQTINGRISLAQARNNKYAQNGGESENTSFYEKLYGNLAATNNGLITEWKAQYDKAVKYIGEHQLTDENAEEYQDYYNRAIQAEQEIYSILQDQESIKKNLRDLRWKSFNDLQKTIQETISDLDALRDTMRDAEFFDSEYGIDITDKGYANLQLLGQSIQQAKQQIKDYRVALEKLDKEYKNGNITVDEYNNLSREYTEQIQDSAKAVAQYEDSIVNMYTTMIQNENQLLQDNINKRKEALQTKKQYYDWDKQIKDKNKDIVQLQAQLNALQGVFICPYLSNCWKTLKTNKPQHKDETCLSVMV